MSKTSIQLEYFHPWPNHAGLVIAQREGLFRDAGIEIELNGRDPFRGVPLDHLVRGEVDFCVDTTRALLQGREQGQRVCAIAAIDDERLDAVITTRRTGAQRPRDLSGHTVEIVASPAFQAQLLDAVAIDGGDPAAVTTIPTRDREPTVLDVEAGSCDAACAYAAWEGVLHPELADELVMFEPVDFGSLSYQPYMLITTEALLTANPVLVEHVLEASRQGYQQAISDPELAARTMHKLIPYFPETVVEASCRALVPKWASPSRSWGELDPERLSAYAKWLLANDMLADSEHASAALATV